MADVFISMDVIKKIVFLCHGIMWNLYQDIVFLPEKGNLILQAFLKKRSSSVPNYVNRAKIN